MKMKIRIRLRSHKYFINIHNVTSLLNSTITNNYFIIKAMSDIIVILIALKCITINSAHTNF